MKKVRKLRGMTMIEMVLAVAILAVLVAVCTAMLYLYLEAYDTQEAIVKEELQVRQAMLSIAQEIHKLQPDLGPGGDKFTPEGVAIGFEWLGGSNPQIVTGANSLTLYEAGGGAPWHDYQLVIDTAAGDGSYKIEDHAAAGSPALIATGIAPPANGGFTVSCDPVDVPVLEGGVPIANYEYIKDVTIQVRGMTGWVNVEKMVIRVYRG